MENVDTLDLSMAESNKWLMIIEDFDALQYTLIDFTPPTVSSGYIEVGNPYEKLLWMPGNRVEYTPFNVTFNVQQSYDNYFKLLEWLIGNVKNHGSKDVKYRSVTLHLLDNQQAFQNRGFMFLGAFPINISPLVLDSVGGAIGNMSVNAEFAFIDMLLVGGDQNMVGPDLALDYCVSSCD